ncbi:hypothetical protein L596_021851 [Steinernema carpocapsae]|uniref:Uncharacterized protein n=1 Tax=Steinernema carpocapsae TaxID=34508 RepID=A0A4U5MK20_STECR|nr:hypothetical protein L596_021851 [Steinernema carpocapsae]
MPPRDESPKSTEKQHSPPFSATVIRRLPVRLFWLFSSWGFSIVSAAVFLALAVVVWFCDLRETALWRSKKRSPALDPERIHIRRDFLECVTDKRARNFLMDIRFGRGKSEPEKPPPKKEYEEE